MAKPQHIQSWAAALDGDSRDAESLWAAVGSFDSTPNTEVDVDAGWAALSAKLAESDRTISSRRASAKTSRSLRRRPATRKVLGVAAAAAVALLLVINWLSAPSQSSYEYGNATTAVQQVELGDKSTISLEPGARVSFTEGDDSRTATLSGSARFDVAKDGARPFSVTGENFRLVVMGTSFTIRTGEPTSVVVHEGHVRLQGVREADWLDLYEGDSTVVVDQLAELPQVAHPDGPLVFRSAKLSFVAMTLEAQGIGRFVIPVAMSDCEVVADWTDHTAEQIADAIQVAFDVKIRRKGGSYVLLGRGCGG